MKKKKLKNIAAQIAQLEKDDSISNKEKESRIMELIAPLSLEEMLMVDTFTQKILK